MTTAVTTTATDARTTDRTTAEAVPDDQHRSPAGTVGGSASDARHGPLAGSDLARAGDESTAPALLSVRNLQIGFAHVPQPLVRGVSFDLRPGSSVALVGESGSGKSLTARTLVGLTGAGAQVSADRLALAGARPSVGAEDDIDLLTASPRQWQRIRGGRVGFVLQDALVSLDPLRRIGQEIDEVLRLHTDLPRRARRERVHELLADAGIPSPALRAQERPSQLSGGLRQRALIASAIAAGPEILIADEPTTALDSTVQAQVLELLAQRRAAGQALLLISHDLAVVADVADEVLVMRSGEVVERGAPQQVLHDPQHPYTQALVRAIPGPATRGTRLAAPTPEAAETRGVTVTGASTASAPVDSEPETVLQVDGVRKTFRTPGGERRVAVADVSLTLRRGEILGIVGESGSGKSTTGRIVLGLEDVDAGSVRLLGRDWTGASAAERRRLRHRVSVVWQDPLSSFDPRWSVRTILTDALRAADRAAEADGRAAPLSGRVETLLDAVGLTPAVVDRDPATLSGGQRQRVAIARALAGSPDVLVLDEAVSALDVSVQAQILDLLADLRRERGVSALFISHDLSVIAHLCDRVLVMKDGRIVEEGHPESLFADPQQPYTQLLVGSALGLHGSAVAASNTHIYSEVSA
jgi:peptide/nickel transport system ATP-binding protein